MQSCQTSPGSRRRSIGLGLRSLVALVCALVACTALAQGGGDGDDSQLANSIPIKALVEAIENALADARRYNDQPPYFLVKKIELKLSVVRKDSAEGGVGFEVPVLPVEVSIGGDIVAEAAETVTMSLKPAPQTLVGAAEQISLAELMREVKAALPSQAGSGGGLSLTQIIYTTRFTLQHSIDGGIDFAFIKAGGEVSQSTSQQIEFALCQTADLLDCVE